MAILPRLNHRWIEDGAYTGSPLEDQVGSVDFTAISNPGFYGYDEDEGPYVFMPNNTLDFLTASNVAVSTTGFLDFRVRVRHNWDDTTRMVFGPRHGPDGDNGFWLEWDNSPSNTLRFGWSPDGTDAAFISHNATTTFGVAGTSIQTIRVLLTFADAANSNNYTLKFFRRASDEDSWTQIGATINGGAATSVYAGAETSRISGFQGSGSNPLKDVRLYYMRVLDATGSVFNLDAGRVGAFVVEAGQPAKLIEEHGDYEYTLTPSDTIVSSGSIQFVDSPSFQFHSGIFTGGDNADYPAGGPMLVYAVVRLLKGYTDEQMLIGKAVGAGAALVSGWGLYLDSSERAAFKMADGITSRVATASAALAIGQTVAVMGYRVGTTQEVWVQGVKVGEVSGALTDATIANAVVLSLGGAVVATTDEGRSIQLLDCGIMFGSASESEKEKLPEELGLVEPTAAENIHFTRLRSRFERWPIPHHQSHK